MKGYQVENIPREYESFHFTPFDFMGFWNNQKKCNFTPTDLNSILLITYKTWKAKSFFFFIFQ